MNFECKDDLVLCDSEQIRQALIALYMNAIEAMENGGELTVRTACLQDRVQIEIRDSGCGIPAEILPEIFDPFFSTKEEGKGVGLGLAVVYGIIERHQGDIRIESQPDRGTTVFIELPRNPRIESDQ